MKTLLINLILIFSLSSRGNTLYDFAEISKDGAKIVSGLGLNCGSPNNWGVFVEEFENIASNTQAFISELGLQTGGAKDFPNICHVLTTNQINSYREDTQRTVDKKCVVRLPKPFKGCKVHNTITTDKPIASYWWPKYLIEVSEKGNDHHESFTNNNALYKLNRGLASGLSNLFDVGGVVKLASLLELSMKGLEATGIAKKPKEGGSLDSSKAIVLSPFEKMRVTSNSQKNLKTLEGSIWPIVSSKVLAEGLTVCGPDNLKLGRETGGFGWDFKGVPMTCPVALSSDAYSYWDSGIIDFLDPEFAQGLLIGSNPLTCGMAQAQNYFSNERGANSAPVGEQKEIKNQQAGLNIKDKMSLSKCSFPILGPAQAIAKKTLAMTDMKKWKQVKCTLWGNIAPRSSQLTMETDYSYANTALKFKLFSHEMFGVPRGDNERWSIAYPWEGSGSQESGGAIGSFNKFYDSSFSENIKKVTGGKMDLPNNNSSNRSEGLFVVGDPRFINASASIKYIQNRTKEIAREASVISALATSTSGLDPISRSAAYSAFEANRYSNTAMGNSNSVGGDKRIYTIWEKVSCVGSTTRVKTTFPVSVTAYSSCRDAIKYEARKYFQIKYLRKLCDFLGHSTGKPWK